MMSLIRLPPHVTVADRALIVIKFQARFTDFLPARMLKVILVVYPASIR